MMDFLTAVGLMCMLEGAAYALFPDGMKKSMEKLLALPSPHIRMFGLIFAIFGFLIIGVLRGF